MKAFFEQFFNRCPQSGKIRKIILPGGFSTIFIPLVGLAAMVWILIRVIPKPSRLSYPCMRTAMPLACGFIGYVMMLGISAVAFFRSKMSLRYFPVFFLGIFFACGISGFALMETGLLNTEVILTENAAVAANEPIGIAQGMKGKEGRVVWIHNAKAVNQNCSPGALNHAWWMGENNNQGVIDAMVSAAIDSLTGQKSDSAAWMAIFQYHNEKRGKGAAGYAAGEKIFIKINECSAWDGNFNAKDLSKVNGSWYGMSETSPAIVLSVLHQLVDIVHVAESDIYIGDPIRNIYKEWYEQWKPKYPNVHYLGYGNFSSLGREQVKRSSNAAAKIYFSDRGTVLRANVMYPTSLFGKDPIWYDSLYTIFEDAEYMLNIPQLKGHMRAGISLFAKNHFGSQTRSSAGHLHNGLPCPTQLDYGDTSRAGYGLYRIQVDLMTQSLLRKKNLIYLLDGLWGTDYEQDKPLKWKMAPFNTTFSSSVFASLDNVAIESVGYDFLRSEFTVGNITGKYAFVQVRGVDDYLHQAADSTNWPAGIKYDPDNTGVHIYSLGVHEHWNNASEKKYSRNLGTGKGIELLGVEQGSATGVAGGVGRAPEGYTLSQNYPNPFNPATIINYSLPAPSRVLIIVYDVAGREIETIENRVRSAGTYSIAFNAHNLGNGLYFYRITAGAYTETKKFLLLK